MLGIAFIVLLPLTGWWLIRSVRPYERLAQTVNEHDVDLGFHSFRGKATVFTLCSDPRFMAWLLLRKYRDQEFPAEVLEALDKARRGFFLANASLLPLVLVTLAIQFSG